MSFSITPEPELNVNYDVIRYKDFHLGVTKWMKHCNAAIPNAPLISNRLLLRVSGYKANSQAVQGIEYFVQCTSNALPSKYEMGATHNIEPTEVDEGVIILDSTDAHKNRELLRTLFRLLAFIDTLEKE